ncbi:hypothetical protein ACSLVK_04360 [Photorhabdus tasmaniensis]
MYWSIDDLQALAIMLHQFYAIESSPAVSFVTDEKSELLKREPL